MFPSEQGNVGKCSLRSKGYTGRGWQIADGKNETLSKEEPLVKESPFVRCVCLPTRCSSTPATQTRATKTTPNNLTAVLMGGALPIQTHY